MVALVGIWHGETDNDFAEDLPSVVSCGAIGPIGCSGEDQLEAPALVIIRQIKLGQKASTFIRFTGMDFFPSAVSGKAEQIDPDPARMGAVDAIERMGGEGHGHSIRWTPYHACRRWRRRSG